MRGKMEQSPLCSGFFAQHRFSGLERSAGDRTRAIQLLLKSDSRFRMNCLLQSGTWTEQHGPSLVNSGCVEPPNPVFAPQLDLLAHRAATRIRERDRHRFADLGLSEKP